MQPGSDMVQQLAARVEPLEKVVVQQQGILEAMSTAVYNLEQRQDWSKAKMSDVCRHLLQALAEAKPEVNRLWLPCKVRPIAEGWSRAVAADLGTEAAAWCWRLVCSQVKLEACRDLWSCLLHSDGDSYHAAESRQALNNMKADLKLFQPLSLEEMQMQCVKTLGFGLELVVTDQLQERLQELKNLQTQLLAAGIVPLQDEIFEALARM